MVTVQTVFTGECGDVGEIHPEYGYACSCSGIHPEAQATQKVRKLSHHCCSTLKMLAVLQASLPLCCGQREMLARGPSAGEGC